MAFEPAMPRVMKCDAINLLSSVLIICILDLIRGEVHVLEPMLGVAGGVYIEFQCQVRPLFPGAENRKHLPYCVAGKGAIAARRRKLSWATCRRICRQFNVEPDVVNESFSLRGYCFEVFEIRYLYLELVEICGFQDALPFSGDRCEGSPVGMFLVCDNGQDREPNFCGQK